MPIRPCADCGTSCQARKPPYRCRRCARRVYDCANRPVLHRVEGGIEYAMDGRRHLADEEQMKRLIARAEAAAEAIRRGETPQPLFDTDRPRYVRRQATGGFRVVW